MDVEQLFYKIELLHTETGELLSKGLFQEASAAGSHTLRLLLPRVLEGNEDMDSDHYEMPGALMGCMEVQHNVLIESSGFRKEERIFSIFGHAFFLKPKFGKRSSWTLKDYRCAAASAVYNIALSHHLLGLQDANNRHDLEKALKAYQAAGALLSSTTSDLIQEDEGIKLLALAITNNEGHIHERVFALDKADECLQKLRSILPYTLWSDEMAHFHSTALLFSHTDGAFLHSPIA